MQEACTWRPGRLQRCMFSVVAVGQCAVAATAASAAYETGEAGAWQLPLLFGLIGLGFLLHAHGSWIRLDAHQVTVSNLGIRRSIDLSSVASVTPGYTGITIQTSEDRRLLGTAVQKTNISRWLGRYSCADAVSDAVRQAAGLPMRGTQPGHR